MKKTISILVLSLFFASANAQEITSFSNFFGTKYYQDKTKLKYKEVDELLKSEPKAALHWKKSQNYLIAAGITSLANITFFVIEVSDNRPVENTSNNVVNGIGYFGSLAGIIIFDLLRKSQEKKAILEYNESLSKKTAFKLRPSNKGIGVVLTF